MQMLPQNHRRQQNTTEFSKVFKRHSRTYTTAFLGLSGGGAWPGLHGPVATTWVPMGARRPASSPNDHPTPSPGPTDMFQKSSRACVCGCVQRWPSIRPTSVFRAPFVRRCMPRVAFGPVCLSLDPPRKARRAGGVGGPSEAAAAAGGAGRREADGGGGRGTARGTADAKGCPGPAGRSP